MGEAAKGTPQRFQAPGHDRPLDAGGPNGDVDAELAESRRRRDQGSPAQDCRGALFPLDPRAGLVHMDVPSRDVQPLLRRGDRPREGARAQGQQLGVTRIARRPQRRVAGAGILEGERGSRL